MRYSMTPLIPTLYSYNPAYLARKRLYQMNALAFSSEYVIKQSSLIADFLMPTQTMTNQKNPNRNYLWERYLQGASWAGYPKQYLDKILGLSLKGYPNIKGFTGRMQDFFEYATTTKTSLIDIQIAALSNIIKYGSTMLRIVIEDQADISNTMPKVEAIPGNEILDAKVSFNVEKNRDVCEWVVWKTDENILNEAAKSYQTYVVLHVLGLNEEGFCYEAELLESQYSQFDFKHPDASPTLGLTMLAWAEPLREVPVIFCTSDNLCCEWRDAYAQPLIDLSLHAFQADADNSFALHQQSTAHLVITGADPAKTYTTGLGTVHVFDAEGAKESFVAPPTAGISLQFDKLKDLKAQIESMMLNIAVAANASGIALQLHIGDKTNSLIAFIKNVGNAVQRISEEVASITGAGDPDLIEYIPYTDFAQENEEIETIEEVDNEDQGRGKSQLDAKIKINKNTDANDQAVLGDK